MTTLKNYSTKTSNEAYQVCTRCVMDSSAVDIQFDKEGICNYCTNFLHGSSNTLKLSSSEKENKLKNLIDSIKNEGKGKQYDCIVGVSGGVDSSWVLVQAVKLGLRPLAVHMDNGWDSELAQNNISNLVRDLNVDLFTHVIDWFEYKSLMQAFFDADVIDVELLYDNAMLSINYRLAAKHRVSFILSGSNQATEGMEIPPSWNWFKYDKKNIKSIGKNFGNIRIKTFPAIGTLELIRYEFLQNIKWTSILDLLEYNKFVAMEELQRSFGYKPYPYKHYESIFTRFYQGYLLPEKFGVDKRRLHLSTLVISGQMSRAEAVQGVEGIAYPTHSDLENDVNYFLKKMGWNKEQLIEYISRPEIPHNFYSSEKGLWVSLKYFYNYFKSKEK